MFDTRTVIQDFDTLWQIILETMSFPPKMIIRGLEALPSICNDVEDH